MTTIPIPPAALEAAAKAIHEHDDGDFPHPTPWVDLPGYERDVILGWARAGLTGAFGVGEIREERGTRIGDGSIITLAEAGTRYTLSTEAARIRYVLSVSGGDGWEITTSWRSCGLSIDEETTDGR